MGFTSSTQLGFTSSTQQPLLGIPPTDSRDVGESQLCLAFVRKRCDDPDRSAPPHCVCFILTLFNFSQESEEGADHGGRFVCPLCTLDFSSPEKLISHVYQVRARDLDRIIFRRVSSRLPRCPLTHSSLTLGCVPQHTTMMSSGKSYVCPVCGRALSSPGSLGRHLLIHSEDRLSNCAVCGARFTDTNNFNRLESAVACNNIT